MCSKPGRITRARCQDHPVGQYLTLAEVLVSGKLQEARVDGKERDRVSLHASRLLYGHHLAQFIRGHKLRHSAHLRKTKARTPLVIYALA